MDARWLVDPQFAEMLHAAGIRGAHDLLALGGCGEERRFQGFVDLTGGAGGGRFYLKRYRYAGWRAAKGLVGRGTLWGEAPQVREFRALAWLRAHDLPAVRPVAAGSVRRRGRLVGHALLTEAVPDARALDVRLHDPRDPLCRDAGLRRGLVRRIGAALARAHALGFAHRDCHARNLLVRVQGPAARFWFLDCRRGGVGGARHGPLDDLARLDRDLRGVLSRTDRRRALAAYEPDRGAAGRLLARVAARRDRLPAPRPPGR